MESKRILLSAAIWEERIGNRIYATTGGNTVARQLQCRPQIVWHAFETIQIA